MKDSKKKGYCCCCCDECEGRERERKEKKRRKKECFFLIEKTLSLLGVLTTMDMFNGGRLEYNRQSSNFVIGHSLSMGSTLEPSNYNFMMQYFDKKVKRKIFFSLFQFFLFFFSLFQKSAPRQLNLILLTTRVKKNQFVALGRINTEGEFQGVINNPVNSWLTLRMNHQVNF